MALAVWAAPCCALCHGSPPACLLPPALDPEYTFRLLLLTPFPVLPQGGGRIAMFPDAVSERAQRHVRELTALAKAGASAALVFVVLRDDCTAWAPCHEVRVGSCWRFAGRQLQRLPLQVAFENWLCALMLRLALECQHQMLVIVTSQPPSHLLHSALLNRFAARPSLWLPCARSSSSWRAPAASGVRPG